MRDDRELAVLIDDIYNVRLDSEYALEFSKFSL
jgi:hypothetical protein